jgi:hypothetical protein
VSLNIPPSEIGTLQEDPKTQNDHLLENGSSYVD